MYLWHTCTYLWYYDGFYDNVLCKNKLAIAIKQWEGGHLYCISLGTVQQLLQVQPILYTFPMCCLDNFSASLCCTTQTQTKPAKVSRPLRNKCFVLEKIRTQCPLEEWHVASVMRSPRILNLICCGKQRSELNFARRIISNRWEYKLAFEIWVRTNRLGMRLSRDMGDSDSSKVWPCHRSMGSFQHDLVDRMVTQNYASGRNTDETHKLWRYKNRINYDDIKTDDRKEQQ